MTRIEPALAAVNYQTYQILAPLSTHWRKATCAEFECRHYLQGWRSTIDETIPLGQAQAHHIRKESGRRFTEHQPAPGMTVFTFEPGQQCFASADHRVRLEREELFIVRGGDHRGNPRGDMRRHRAVDWVDDFATHQQDLAAQVEKG